jgi:hypothetical protein
MTPTVLRSIASVAASGLVALQALAADARSPESAAAP